MGYARFLAMIVVATKLDAVSSPENLEKLRQFAAAKRGQLDPEGLASLAHCRYFAQLVAAEVRRGVIFTPKQLPVLLYTSLGFTGLDGATVVAEFEYPTQ